MRAFLRIALASPFIILVVMVSFINVRLFIGPPTSSPNARLLKELRSLKEELNAGADVKMQELYPEGYVFINALYGLSWCNYLRAVSPDATTYAEGHTEIASALKRIQSSAARSRFTKYLRPEYGAFYQGWSNYLLAQKLAIEPVADRDTAEVKSYLVTCDSIASAISDKTYPPSYGGAAWPADVLLCVASLAKHDKLFESKFTSTIKHWTDKVKARLDSSGMIPHGVSPANGSVLEAARGSSQTLMLIFLKDIDPDFAHQQYQLFRDRFIDTTLGLTGIREYSRGHSGFGDVDSGPVVLGYGASATIVGMSTLSVYGDLGNTARLSMLVDSFGLVFENASQRFYLMGILPIADAFIAWGHSLKIENAPEDVSFTTFHLYSVLLLGVLILFVWILIKKDKHDSANVLTIPW